ncbi:MAG: hypothetical protein V3T99_06540 [Nitrososphaerales archaeon]
MSGDEQLSQLVSVTAKLGPRNIPKIARSLSIPVETARHRLRKQLLSRGIGIQACIDYSKLGLQRSWLMLDFTEEFKGRESKSASALAQAAYLVSYFKTIPDDRFVAQVAIPSSSKLAYEQLLESLVKAGVLKSYNIHHMAWTRQISMDTKHYDFRRKTWDIDWQLLERTRSSIQEPMIADPRPFDKKDILILKELETDSSLSFIDIASRLKLEVKTLLYHYHSHIERRSFIDRYSIRWMGDPKRRQRYAIMEVRFWFQKLSQNELFLAQEAFSRLPFMRTDSFSMDDGFYLAELTLPLTHYLDILTFLQKNLKSINRKMEIGIVDQTCASRFPIPEQMYDEEYGWVFHPGVALDRFKLLTTTPELSPEAKKRKE